jgi:hypothetical protein
VDPIDLTERRFGRLVVVRRVGSNGKRAMWLCVCDCGNICIRSLRRETRSCGCVRREHARAMGVMSAGNAHPRFVPYENRYWAKVDKCGPIVAHMTTPCWIWMGSRGRSGHGQFHMGKPHTHPVLAHRVGWTLARGQIPEGMSVLHKCDVGACQNPDHLYLGTAKQNSADCTARGRRNTARGVESGNCRLTELDVRAIRCRALAGSTHRFLATEYGVTHTTIGRIVRGAAWAHLAE